VRCLESPASACCRFSSSSAPLCLDAEGQGDGRMNLDKFKVIVWGNGQYRPYRVARKFLRNDVFELVGVKVYSDGKDRQGCGRNCAISAPDRHSRAVKDPGDLPLADCRLCALLSDGAGIMTRLRTLLKQGVNVVTTAKQCLSEILRRCPVFRQTGRARGQGREGASFPWPRASNPAFMSDVLPIHAFRACRIWRAKITVARGVGGQNHYASHRARKSCATISASARRRRRRSRSMIS